METGRTGTASRRNARPHPTLSDRRSSKQQRPAPQLRPPAPLCHLSDHPWSARDLQLLAYHNGRRGQAVQLRDFLPPGTVPQLLLGNAPERVSLDHGVDFLPAAGGDVFGIDPAVHGRPAARLLDEVVRMLGAGGNAGDLGRSRLALDAGGGVGVRVMGIAGELHDVAHLQAAGGPGAGAGLCAASASGGWGADALTGVGHIGQLAVLSPGPGVVARLGADVPHSGHLHLVLPSWSTLNGEAIADVDADVTLHYQFHDIL